MKKALPKQARARQKRSALIEAAIRDFSELGFEIATAKSIAATAGVATGTFYQYFDNKNEILRVIAQERYDELQTHIQWFEVQDIDQRDSIQEPDLERVFRRILQSVYDFHKSSLKLHQVLEQRKSLDAELLQIVDEGQGLLFSPILKFVQSFNVEYAEVIANNLFAMGEGIVHRHVFDRPELDSKQVIETGAKMLVSYFTQLRDGSK